MGLRFDPMGGGQFKQAVKSIIEAESQPVKQLEKRKSLQEAKMKLFQEFKGKFSNMDKALEEVASFKKFRELKVDMGDGQNMASVTVDKDKATPGTYDITVNDLAAKTSVRSNAFEDPDEAALGIGFVVMYMPDGEKREVFVEEKMSSLNGVAKLINQQMNSPVTAAVMKDSSGDEPEYRLVITAKKDGRVNEIEFPDFYFLDGEREFEIDDTRDAKNGQITMNGFDFEVEGNNIPDFLPGVNLHLKQAKPDTPFTMTITEDFQKIAGKMKGLVEKMNDILGFINKQNTIDQSTDTKGTFAGDTSLQTMEFRLRNLMHEGFPVGDLESGENLRIVFLSDLGVEFDKTGTIQFKEDRFTKFMEKDFEALSGCISGPMGFANQLKEVIRNYTNPSGTLAVREKGMRSQIQQIDNQIDAKNRQLEKRQQSLTDQFSRLQGTLSGLQRQQQALSAAMPVAGGGGGVAALLGG